VVFDDVEPVFDDPSSALVLGGEGGGSSSAECSALVPDDGPVEKFVAYRPHPPLGERAGLWRAGWVMIASTPTAANTWSKLAVYWPPPSWVTTERAGRGARAGFGPAGWFRAVGVWW
jgi:hypothetical protein